MAVSTRAIPLDVPKESRLHRAVLRRAWWTTAGLARKVEARLPDPQQFADDADWCSPKVIAFVHCGVGMP
jgi:hypothetical protein